VASYDTLCVERPEPAIVVVRLDRPERLNAITFEMFDGFVRLQHEVESDAAACVVVLSGSWPPPRHRTLPTRSRRTQGDHPRATQLSHHPTGGSR